MRTIDLSKIDKELVFSSSSKGNLPKWKVGNTWYKTDGFGYESLSEVIISHLIKDCSVLPSIKYDPVRIILDEKEYVGCESYSFLGKNERLITLDKLHRVFYGKGIGESLSKLHSVEDCIKYSVDLVFEKTGLDSFGPYLSCMLQNDAFFLNEDRHYNNIAVIYDEDKNVYRLCPVFDNGLSLCSALDAYPVNDDIYALIDSVKAKPFERDYIIQTETADKLYGCDLKYSFSKNDIENELCMLSEYYPDDIINRVRIILFEQMRKWSFLFE